MIYDLNKPWLTLDQWQGHYINNDGNCILLCGRQSGKTTAASIKFGTYAATHDKVNILMLGFTERQAYNLFFKTLMFLQDNYPKLIKKGKDKPTQHIINLTNGSRILCYAAGIYGEGIRTYTIHKLVVDEAAPMMREVFIAILPMLAVTGGTIDMLSTPRGKEGYFYDTWVKKNNFTKYHINAEDCPRHTKEHLEDMKKSMTRLEYAQEYQAIFLDEIKQLIPDDVIRSCMTASRVSSSSSQLPIYSAGYNFLGVDIARMGGDQTVLFSVVKNSHDRLVQIDMEIYERTLLTETVSRIKIADKKYNYKKIYIDDGGLGTGVFDPLLDDEQTKRKVVAINNAARSLNKENTHRKRLFKEDLYNNLVYLMENKKIELFNDNDIFLSLKSVLYEYQDGKLRIYGNYTHIAEALIRAAWCMKDKSLNIWIA